MRTRHHLKWLATLGLLASLLAGCASTKPSRLYILFTPDDLSPLAGVDAELPAFEVAVGPIRIPPHLERPVLITQSTEAELTYSEFHRWASSLDRQVEQAVLANLSALLGTSAVFPYPNPDVHNPDARVVISIERMSGRLGDQATLDVRWQILQPNAPSPLASETASLTRDLPDASHAAYATALSLMLADLSRDIAQAVIETQVTGEAPAP